MVRYFILEDTQPNTTLIYVPGDGVELTEDEINGEQGKHMIICLFRAVGRYWETEKNIDTGYVRKRRMYTKHPRPELLLLSLTHSGPSGKERTCGKSRIYKRHCLLKSTQALTQQQQSDELP